MDPQEWFYDDLAIEEMETGEEPDPESDEDYYDDTYANRRKRRGVAPTGPGSRGGRRGNKQPDDTPAKRGRAVNNTIIYNFEIKSSQIYSYQCWKTKT